MSDPISGQVPVVLQPAPSDRTRRRGYTRDILMGLIVALALIQSIYLATHTIQNAAAAAANNARQVCAGRYQDAVDAADTDRSSAIGELVVIITQIPPGTERETSVTNTIAELKIANTQSSIAVTEKAKYNKDGRPLPCPLDQT